MQREDCVEVGYIAKAHGLQGSLKAVWDVHDLSEYRRIKTLYLAKKGHPLVAYEVESLRIQGQQITLKLVGVNDRDAADALRSHTLYFPAAQLPDLPEGHFYYFDVIGFQVVDEHKGALGLVKDFIDGSAHDLLVMDYKGKEVLVPMTEDFVGAADHTARSLKTRLPEGLLELYLGEADTEEEE